VRTDPHEAMQNWARWADSGDANDLGAKISSLWRFWLPHKHRDDGWGDPGQPEAIPDPIDIRYAELTDKALKRIAWQHYNILRRWYYRHQKSDSERLEEALRALGDELN
jgi:hypothetical protein